MTSERAGQRRWWQRDLLRVAGGALTVVLFFLGRGIRADLASGLPAYWIGTACILSAATIAVLVFVLLPASRLAAPPRGRSEPRRVGLVLLGLAAVMLAMAGLLVLAGKAIRVAASVLSGFLGTPDLLVKVAAALMAAAAGIMALRGSRFGRPAVRLAAIPLALIWPLGALVGAWAAWATLAPSWHPAPESETNASPRPARALMLAGAGLVLGLVLGGLGTWLGMKRSQPTDYRSCMVVALERGLEVRSARVMCEYLGFAYEPPGRRGALPGAPSDSLRDLFSFDDLIPPPARGAASPSTGPSR